MSEENCPEKKVFNDDTDDEDAVSFTSENSRDADASTRTIPSAEMDSLLENGEEPSTTSDRKSRLPNLGLNPLAVFKSYVEEDQAMRTSNQDLLDKVNAWTTEHISPNPRLATSLPKTSDMETYLSPRSHVSVEYVHPETLLSSSDDDSHGRRRDTPTRRRELRRQLRAVIAENRTLSESVRQHERDLEDCQEELRKSQAEARLLRAMVERKRCDIAGMVEQAQKHVEETSAELDSLRQQNTDLMVAERTASALREALEEETKSLHEEMCAQQETFQNAHADFVDTVKRLRQQVKELQSERDFLESSLEEMETQVKGAQEESYKHKTLLEKALSENELAHSQMQSQLSSRNQILEEKQREFENFRDEVQNNLATLRYQVSSSELPVTTDANTSPNPPARLLLRTNSGRLRPSQRPAAEVFPVPPVWVKDEDCPDCQRCNFRFTFTRRRHHCRHCGGLFCSTCCSGEAVLPKRFGVVGQVRVCNDCLHHLQSEALKQKKNEFRRASQSPLSLVQSPASQPTRSMSMSMTHSPYTPTPSASRHITPNDTPQRSLPSDLSTSAPLHNSLLASGT